MAETCFIAETRHLTQGSEMAVKRAKRAAGHLCEVTGQNASRQRKWTSPANILLTGAPPPDLADLTDNILVITPDRHQEFHTWMARENCTRIIF